MSTEQILESHLLQMRGLKPLYLFTSCSWFASHLLQMRGLKHLYAEGREGYLPSHLLQMRGLKLVEPDSFISIAVASFTDAWIETSPILMTRHILASHLLQMRGLKLPLCHV